MKFLEKKLQIANILVLLVYATVSMRFYFRDREGGYGLDRLDLIFFIICLVSLMVTIFYLVSSEEQDKLVLVACKINLFPACSLALLFSISPWSIGITQNFFGDDHGVLILYTIVCLLSILGVIVSMFLFLIGIAKFFIRKG
jgi:hypothetical protein